MKNFITYILILISLVFVSCEDEGIKLKTFTTIPGNVEAINTPNDDYGEAIGGFLYEDISFLSSSNDDSDGDFVNIKNSYLSFHEGYSSTLVFSLDNDGYDYFDSALVVINSDADKFSPYVYYSKEHESDAIIYASENEDNLDLYFTFGDFDRQKWTGPLLLSKLNTSSNEKNLFFYNNTILYASDESGNYDIIKVDIPYGNTLREWIESTSSITKSSFDEINSIGNDICPYVSGNFIFFSSDRAGGYGGYDLYYSQYRNGSWSEPVNLGPNINSEYDELNPLPIYYMSHTNDLMFFTSNRPGGLGGYDIYYVGIPSILN